MKLIENIDKIEINDSNKFFLEDMSKKYIDYINLIQKLDERMMKYYLETLKGAEIMNNQQAEQENSFLISLYSNMQKENSLDRLIKILNEEDSLSKENLKKLHKILMRGTNSEKGSGEYRKTDTKFVGTFSENGEKIIDYMPILSKKIDYNMDKVIEIINNKNIDNPFINPFIVHALISVMQPFNDGNTRMSRLIQHGMMWKNTKSLYNTNFDKPIIYLSKNYWMTRPTYRKLFTTLANEESNEAWNMWFKYNFNILDEQLYYLDNNVKQLIKKC